MTTKRDQFMEWLRRNPKHQCLDDELADAAARIFEGPDEPEIVPVPSGLGFVIRRDLRLPTYEYLQNKNPRWWTAAMDDAAVLYRTREAAEAALAKSKGTDQ